MPKGNNEARWMRPNRLTMMLVSFVVAAVLAGVVGSGLLLPAAGSVGLLTKAGTSLFDDLPQELDLLPPSQQSVMLASDGSVMARFFAENRIVVPLAKMSPSVRKAAISIEDRRFYNHQGVDIEGLGRALVNNLAGADVQGASTLTQQYVKNSLLEAGLQTGDEELMRRAREHTVGRKVREARYALAIEKQMSKDQILEGYLNIAPFGPSVYGVESASRYYFSKPAEKLTVAEGALLAGITQSPKNLNPVDNPEAAVNRRNVVLGAMLRDGAVSQAEYDQAVATPLKAMLKIQKAPQGCGTAGSAAYFCAYVVNELYRSKDFGANVGERRNRLLRGGLQIRTTLDPQAQRAAHEAAVRAIPINDPSTAKIAIAAIEPGTGKIRALAQNTNYGTNSKDDPQGTETIFAVDKAHGGGANGFQTGSSFKLFTLIQWFQDGHGAYETVGTRTSFPRNSWNIPCNPGLATNYSPRNVIQSTSLPVMRAAQLSINTAFMDMANQMDLCQIMQRAADLGVADPEGKPLEPNPAAILGAHSSTPLAMANAYATIAADGKYCQPIPLESLIGADGKKYKVQAPTCKQVIDPQVSGKVSSVLAGVVNHYRPQIGGVSHPAGGKTGTTNDFGAAWMVGYTKQLSAAVWLGHSQGLSSLAYQRIGGRYYGSMYGSTLAGPTWREFMNAALEGKPSLPIPAGDLGPPPRPATTEITETIIEEVPAAPNQGGKPKPKPVKPPRPADD